MGETRGLAFNRAVRDFPLGPTSPAWRAAWAAFSKKRVDPVVKGMLTVR